MLIDFLSFCLSSSAGSIGTSLASHISHLHNAFFYHLPASLFLVHCFSEEPSYYHYLFIFLWVFFVVDVEHLLHRMHSTAQRSQPRTKQQSKYASKQSWREPAHTRRRAAARCVLKTNEEIEICPVYKKRSNSNSSF